LVIIKEKNPDLKNKEWVAGEVALGAIKYGDLVHNRKSDIVFRWDEVLNFEGNTGPYLQYTHARLCSILRKAGFKVPKVIRSVIPATEPGSSLDSDFRQNDKHVAGQFQPEQKLMRSLTLFPDKVADAAAGFLPNILAEYLFELAGTANAFYQSSPVVQEKDQKVRELRLAVVAATANVLKTGLGLLGIDAPEEM